MMRREIGQIIWGLGQPQVAALDLGGAPDDDPSDGEQGDGDGNGLRPVGMKAAVRWA
jgi:hypothetical protein